MKDINIGINSTIRESMRKLSLAGQKSLVVTDKNNKLLGTLSDGDLRKAILNGSLVNDSINGILQKARQSYFKINLVLKKLNQFS